MVRFCTIMTLNRIERFCKCNYQLDLVNTFFFYLGSNYLQIEQSIESFKGKFTPLFFLYTMRGASMKMATFFRNNSGKQTNQSSDPNGHTARRNANKKYSKPCQVISKYG